MTRPNETPKARLLVSIPANRYNLSSEDAQAPKVGDLVVYDQSYRDEDGRPMGLVHYFNGQGDIIYSAEIYDNEAELVR